MSLVHAVLDGALGAGVRGVLRRPVGAREPLVELGPHPVEVGEVGDRLLRPAEEALHRRVEVGVGSLRGHNSIELQHILNRVVLNCRSYNINMYYEFF